MATTVWPWVSGLSVVFDAVGSLTLMPCCKRGATSIMMISSTSMTSTSGVTLMSDLTPPLAPPRSIAIVGSPLPGHRYPRLAGALRRLLDEVVDQLGRRVVHLDVEVLDPSRQVVV